MTRRAARRLGRPPLPPGVKNERFSCYVPEAVREGLDALAAEQHTTRTNLVRAILTQYVAARRALPDGVSADETERQGPAERGPEASQTEHGLPVPAGGRR